MCLNRKNKKEAGVGPFFLKKTMALSWEGEESLATAQFRH